MTVAPLRLVGTALPPIVLDPARARRVRCPDPLPRLGRLACALAALALPALGVSVTDLVHRAGDRGAAQAAASASPFGGAAAPAARPPHTVRVAALESPEGGRP